MPVKKRWLLFVLAVVFGLTAACGSTSPQVVEVTRLVPEVFVVTVVVTAPFPTFTPAPPSTPTITPTLDPDAPRPTATTDPNLWYPLLNCPPSRLKIGKTAVVGYLGGHNAIRSTADVEAVDNIVGYAEPGETMTVIGGPVCNWNWVLWKVKTTKGVEGWTPEGDGKIWWLEPAG